ncbi:hypothetical protein Y032_0885g2856 [Ancylostoma ceylanicum]|uniref:Serine carboxypeptidase n=1 Tax=Ancylostoma ceylanicum TaxID=53326 RepID=A0A016WAB9_9BILA|nr:hypothetical protein Y032_0885g2856 [Ancylostoma ceylanicum]
MFPALLRKLVTHPCCPTFRTRIAGGRWETAIFKTILIYNGDVDTVCSYVMNRQFLSKLNRTIIGQERVNQPWRYIGENPTVAGFQLKYQGGIDFVTVRGSGHFVPEDKPREALQLIYNFVQSRDYSLPTPF